MEPKYFIKKLKKRCIKSLNLSSMTAEYFQIIDIIEIDNDIRNIKTVSRSIPKWCTINKEILDLGDMWWEENQHFHSNSPFAQNLKKYLE